MQLRKKLNSSSTSCFDSHLSILHPWHVPQQTSTNLHFFFTYCLIHKVFSVSWIIILADCQLHCIWVLIGWCIVLPHNSKFVSFFTSCIFQNDVMAFTLKWHVCQNDPCTKFQMVWKCVCSYKLVSRWWRFQKTRKNLNDYFWLLGVNDFSHIDCQWLVGHNDWFTCDI